MAYVFKAANATVEISVAGGYRDSMCKDVDVAYDGGERGFDECDDADEIIQWLVDQGVEFESGRSMAFNRACIQSVLIDGDATVGELLDEAAAWTDAEIADRLQFIER